MFHVESFYSSLHSIGLSGEDETKLSLVVRAGMAVLAGVK